MSRFTIRVYGLLIHAGRILVADEVIKGRRITKFPGGGLEFGEGTKDCLIREIREEVGVSAFVLEHFYTTDFFQQSAFHTEPLQVLSIYYTFSVEDPEAVPVVSAPFAGMTGTDDQEVFRWIEIGPSADDVMSLPIDRVVLAMARSRML